MAAPIDTVADDDALYVLTAVLLTPAQFPSVLGDDYPAACAALALEPYSEGYGLVLGQDGSGARWTVVVEDVSLVAVAIAAWDCGMDYDLSPDDRSVVCALPGWPLPVAVAAPGVAAPHDPLPDPEAEGTEPAPLTPPDTESWGPAQRRMGADEIAHQWTAWREQIDDETAFADPPGTDSTGGEATPGSGPEPASGSGPESAPGAGPASGSGPESAPGAGPGSEPVPEPDPRLDAPDPHPEAEVQGEGGIETEAGGDLADDAAVSPVTDSPSGVHPGVRRALAQAHDYIDAPPPPGRVRSSFATGEARMLRADGPGWSLVARTDDIAFILLDEEPGEVLPVGRGSELPGLLKGLDALAVRPA
ncbi:hypothetical protein OOK39_38110 [Streptomyces sp. NBC_00264]|uniref:hypothetical protein n=1 Tax=unclassified Streptomyces TaxID=2593676 RepID=UPI002250E740|nr:MULTISPECIES: hypothetical protein [unclassified Streptomyces]MCX5165036.1 hypothetical protein [Streptomyces sp. NBC_00305]MCX5223559.1 hypothetical protein [Streptomyces sp. NBC_00264]